MPPQHWTFHCPLCDRAFMDDKTRKQHLLFSKKCDIIEAYLTTKFLLADAEAAKNIYREMKNVYLEMLQVAS